MCTTARLFFLFTFQWFPSTRCKFLIILSRRFWCLLSYFLCMQKEQKLISKQDGIWRDDDKFGLDVGDLHFLCVNVSTLSTPINRLLGKVTVVCRHDNNNNNTDLAHLISASLTHSCCTLSMSFDLHPWMRVSCVHAFFSSVTLSRISNICDSGGWAKYRVWHALNVANKGNNLLRRPRKKSCVKFHSHTLL